MQIVPASVLLEISGTYVNHRSRRDSSWYWYQEGDAHGAIPLVVTCLYRGQNVRHLPLLPSIARGLQSTDIVKIRNSSVLDQAKIVLRHAQAWWFAHELSRHPIAKHAADQKLDLNEIALAQHYGIPTGYLDLTDDFNVAAFFATCRETQAGWLPVDAGVGVVYRVSLETLASPWEAYTPLGPQRLPRPSEQCAWVTALPLGPSFEGWPGVEMLQFRQDRSVGQHFLEMHAGGEALFPPDPLADVAAEILSCGEIPMDLVEAVLSAMAKDPYGIASSDLPALRKELANLAAPISYRTLLADEALAEVLADEQWVEQMLSPVKARAVAVRHVPIEQDAASPTASGAR